MKILNKEVAKLLGAYSEIEKLEHIQALLGWDQNTYMPPSAAQSRAEQSALITEYISRTYNNPEFKARLQSIDRSQVSPVEQDIIRVLGVRAKFYLKVPQKLVVENSRVTSEAFSVWHAARTANDFEAFAPHLVKIVKLQQDIAHELGYDDDPYDALLDLYEPELTYKQVEQMFKQLKGPLSNMIRAIVASSTHQDATASHIASKHTYDLSMQEKLSHHMMELMGYPVMRGRLDVSPHPFTTTLGFDDVRITTRYDEQDWLSSYSSTMHEGGHALYELGIDPDYAGTPFATGVSLGVHESQSRFFENMVGKDPAMLSALHPTLIAHFPQLAIDDSKLAIMANHVRPGLIRVEADEVTYNMHILLRTQIEHALLHNEITVAEVPTVWRTYMKEYLDVAVISDQQGCLQDVHWSYGSFGYFPTYTIGNLYSASIRAKMSTEIDFDTCLNTLEFGPITSWLREHIHQHGSRYTPADLMKKSQITLNVADYLDYISTKYSRLYHLPAATY